MVNIRIARYLAGAGIASRRHSEQIIAAGRVSVNGQVVTELGQQIDENCDLVELDGNPVRLEHFYYLLLYKPAGYISAAFDDRGRKTVLDLIKEYPARLYPVGRLDCDSKGLLILSNDGNFTHLMTHPRFHIDKEYLVRVEGQVNKTTINKLAQGIDIGDGMTSPAKVHLVRIHGNETWLTITIHEGRNRQVRRMLDCVGHPVKELTRIGYGFLTLDGLKPGQYRNLTSDEVTKLKKAAGLKQ
ncbi:MAG: pseudouridine synthase [Methylocystaceae bacterium]